MDDFLKMDVFFVVATIGFAALSILGALVLWRVLRILKNIEYVSEQVARESDELRRDLGELRKDLRAGKSKMKSFLSFAKSLGKRASKDED